MYVVRVSWLNSKCQLYKCFESKALLNNFIDQMLNDPTVEINIKPYRR